MNKVFAYIAFLEVEFQRSLLHNFWCQVAIAALIAMLREAAGDAGFNLGFYYYGQLTRAEAMLAP